MILYLIVVLLKIKKIINVLIILLYKVVIVKDKLLRIIKFINKINKIIPKKEKVRLIKTFIGIKIPFLIENSKKSFRLGKLIVY
jgi:hypothetical protein